MFKLIKIDFYDEFACMMADCPDNCCDEDWDIYIDDETVEKYRKLGISELESKISIESPHVIIKNNHKCPFITPEGLCTFHRDYGEEYLSNTCRSYPRFVSTYGDVYLETLGMSCPAVVKQVLGCKHLIVFGEKIYYEEKTEIGLIPNVSDAETVARDIISRFEPGKSMLFVYRMLIKDLAEESEHIQYDEENLIQLLKKETSGTPSERYVTELFRDIETVDRDRIVETEILTDRVNVLFSCNVNRIWLFEHLMLDSNNERSDQLGTVIKGMVVWILLLTALADKNSAYETTNDQILIECTYKIMRIVDHGNRLLDVLSEKFLD